MEIIKGLNMLSISSDLANGPGIVHPVLIWDEIDMILVDAGLPSQLMQIREEINATGAAFSNLNRVIITHSDIDHTGGLAGILKASPQKIQVLAHEKEKPYIEAENPPIRMTQMEAQIKLMSPEQRQQFEPLYESLKANYKNLKAVVDKTVEDGEELPLFGGITIIYTPGHTPGHICLYHKRSKTLIAGDCLNVDNEKLVPAPRFTCLDKASYRESIQKLTGFDIDMVICYHGGLYKDNPNERISEICKEVYTQF